MIETLDDFHKLSDEELHELVYRGRTHAELYAEMQEFHRSSRLVNSVEIADQYPDMYAAAHKGGFVIARKNQEEILEYLRERGVPPGDTAIAYNRSEPKI